MTDKISSDTFTFPGGPTVARMGYGAMQLAGPRVFGPPKDRAEAVAVLREAVEGGVNHIDTSDFYGPHVTNQIIAEALYPYADDLTIVTKVGVERDEKGAMVQAREPAQIRKQVEDNLRNLRVDVLDVVNMRMPAGEDRMTPLPGSIAGPYTALAELQQEGLVKQIGISTANAEQVAEANAIAPLVCVQNFYNIANRSDDPLIDHLAEHGVAYVPYFPLGGFTPLQSGTLDDVARRLGATAMAVALAWLLNRAPNVLLIPGTSSLAHLRENLAAVELELSEQDLLELDTIGA
jgi:pyridoxine 4-dehydrogenase